MAGRHLLPRPEAQGLQISIELRNPSRGIHQNGKSIPMALIHYDATTDRSGKSLLDTLRGYFVRYRIALYLFSGAAVALGVALNWNWLTAAGLFPVLAFLPCMAMMFMCMRHGTHGSNEETPPDKTLPPRFPTSSDPLQ